MDRTIRHTKMLPHSPERIWKFLTDSDLLKEWLMENNFKPVVGHEFQFKTKSRPGFDGNIFCKVLVIESNRKLSYSWRGGPGNGKITLDSVVTWTLVAVKGGTELTLEHAGFRPIQNMFAYLFMNKGWAKIISTRLSELLNGVTK